MKKIEHHAINETVYEIVTKNNLKVFLLPKQGFHKTYVTLSTNFGSNHDSFILDGKKYDIPLGSAHFLEHKLFEKAGMDVSYQFALQSAQVNAYTQNNQTTYLFSCTENLKENIQLLTDFVFHPEFTEKGIKKEIGIITEEIKMYEDDPSSVSYLGILNNMYFNHPITHNILGTEATINQINKPILEKIHQAFYKPDNMMMFIAGNFDILDMKSFISNLSIQSTYMDSETDIIYKEEPKKIQFKTQNVEKDVMIPACVLGVKLDPSSFTSSSIMKKELVFSILIDMILGKSSNLYDSLLDREIINDSFSMDITLDKTYGYLLFACNTDKVNEFYQNIQEIVLNIDVDALTKKDFLRTKKQVIGGFIHALNSLEYIANQYTKYHYASGNIFDVLSISQSITLEDVKAITRLMHSENQISTFTVMPQKK
jgi:predicted Zn-dependent peptidase